MELVDFNGEYPRIIANIQEYDLLVSIIGGTYDLADQLPSNCHFDHFLLISYFQVLWEFGVNLA